MRVNGVTIAVDDRQHGEQREHVFEREVALDTGANIIEVVAFDAKNVISSHPARLTVPGPARAPRGKLHILAVGIDSYVDKGWLPPGSSEKRLYPPLSLARKDAERLAADMKTASRGMYDDVIVTLAVDAEATRDKLDAIFTRIGKAISPRDTFIFFAAAHGDTKDGRFYLIPQDHDGGDDPQALAARAIPQELIQHWFAHFIHARRAILFLDTCQSGALIAGYARSRLEAPSSEAAIGRLHEATGRPVLTAAASSEFAHEGVIGELGSQHGIFTAAVLDALRKADTNRNGYVELSELVIHVQDTVPRLAAGLKRGGRAAAVVAAPIFGKQSARFGARGEDFSLLQVIP